MILTKLSKKRKFKNEFFLIIYKVKKKCPERQTMTAVSQSDIRISVDRASKKMGIWKMMTLTYSLVHTNDCHSKQAQELHMFSEKFHGFRNQRQPQILASILSQTTDPKKKVVQKHSADIRWGRNMQVNVECSFFW